MQTNFCKPLLRTKNLEMSTHIDPSSKQLVLNFLSQWIQVFYTAFMDTSTFTQITLNRVTWQLISRKIAGSFNLFQYKIHGYMTSNHVYHHRQFRPFGFESGKDSWWEGETFLMIQRKTWRFSNAKDSWMKFCSVLNCLRLLFCNNNSISITIRQTSNRHALTTIFFTWIQF